jgi:hypothetical protein
LLTAFTAERAADLDTVPVFAELLIVRLFAGAFWDSALPAADLDGWLVRPSRSVFEAALAALGDVDLEGDFVCDNALPAAFLEAAPVDLLFSVFEALDAADLLVTLVLGM